MTVENQQSTTIHDHRFRCQYWHPSRRASDDFLPLKARRLQCWLGGMSILVLAGEWIGIFLLNQVAQGMIYPPMDSLVGLLSKVR